MNEMFPIYIFTKDFMSEKASEPLCPPANVKQLAPSRGLAVSEQVW